MGGGEGKEYEDFLFDEEKNLIETSIEYHFEIFHPVTSNSPRHHDFFLVRISSLTKRKTHCSPLLPPTLPRGFFSRENFFFDEEKNSWLSLNVAMSFSLRQRGNPHEENFLVEGGRNVRVSTLIKKKTLMETSIEHHVEIFSLVTSTPHPTHKEILLVRISSLTKRKTHGNFQGGRNMWISSLTKEKTSLKL